MSDQPIVAAIRLDSDSARSLAGLLRSTSRWQAKLEAAIRQRESGWHRLAVKIDGGQVVLVQMLSEETVTIADKSPPAGES